MMTEALKSCPFCGNPNPEIRHNNIGDSFVICHTDVEGEMCCGASSSECGCETDAGAVRRWNRRAPPASPTGRQLGPGKRDELPPIVSDGVVITPVWPSIGEIAKAGWAWRNDKERETDSNDQRYFEHNWHSLSGLGEYVKAEILKRPEFARSALSKATGEGG